MSFRGKVKAVLEDKKKGVTVTMAHPESQKLGTQGSEGGIKVPHSEVEAYRAKGWVPVEKSKVHESDRVRRTDQSHGLHGEDEWMSRWKALTPAQKKRLKRPEVKKKALKSMFDKQTHKKVKKRKQLPVFEPPITAASQAGHHYSDLGRGTVSDDGAMRHPEDIESADTRGSRLRTRRGLVKKKALKSMFDKQTHKKVEEAKKVKKVTVAQAHRIARAQAEAGVDPKVLASRHPDYVPTEEEKSKWAETVAQSTARIKKHVPKKKVKKGTTPESTTENSDHPFYQKVKELSRAKQNKSLLEKKSKSVKTFKILLGTVDKKSKMVDEAKKDGTAASDPEHEKGLANMDPEAIRRQVEMETKEWQRLNAQDKQKEEPKHKPKPKEEPKERRKSRGGHNDRLNNLARRLGIGGNWF